jgi:hypothetical protein
MYDQIIDRSTQEQNSPSPAPTAPGAVQPNAPGSATPTRASVAAGGAYDMANGPRAR